MARYRRSDGHYADVECAYAEPKRYLVLSSTNKKKATKLLVAANRRTFQPGFYGHTRGTECRVHVQVTGVSCV